MIKKKYILLIFFSFLLTNFLFAQTGSVYPRLQNSPPRLNYLGQIVVDPGHPMAFSRQNGNPGLFPLYPLNALINLGISTTDINIQSSDLFTGFKISNDFFLGFGAGGMVLPKGLKYDVYSLRYIDSESDGALGYWGDMTLGYQVFPGFALGLKAGFYSEDLEQANAGGMNASVGMVWHHFFSDFTLAAHYRNIGSQTELVDTLLNQPSVLNLSLAFDQSLQDFSFYPQASFEYSEICGSQIATSLGISWQKIITLQLGGAFMGDLNYFPWSVGLQGRFAHIDLNYSIAGTDDGGISHLIGFALNIGNLDDAMSIGPKLKEKEAHKYYRGTVKPTATVVLDTALSLSPAPPRNVRLREDQDRVVLEWDPIAQNDTYLVYAKLGEKSVFRKVTPLPITKYEFSFKKPSGDTILFFYVKTKRKDFVSGPSRVVSFAKE